MTDSKRENEWEWQAEGAKNECWVCAGAGVRIRVCECEGGMGREASQKFFGQKKNERAKQLGCR